MKIKFYSKLFITSTALMFVAMNLFSQGTPPVTTIGPATLDAGTFTVPVTVTGFTNVGSFR